MSRTKRQDPADTDNPDDFYETPGFATRALLAQKQAHLRGKVLDAGCGTGAILRVLQEAIPQRRLMGIDLDYGRLQEIETEAELVCADFLKSHPEVNHVVMNPPYGGRTNLAQKFVQHALDIVPQGGLVCALLRLPWACGGQVLHRRADWFRANSPRWIFALDRRPSFTGGGTDGTDYAWFVWQKGDCPPYAEFRVVECGR